MVPVRMDSCPLGDLSPTNTDFDEASVSVSDILIPSSVHSVENIESILDAEDATQAVTGIQKKKKKKKPKKSVKAKEVAANAQNGKVDDISNLEGRPPVLCISRNKHWKYISSYHGPWLQLPLELLESLLVLNLDPATLSGTEPRLPPLPLPPQNNIFGRPRDRDRLYDFADYSPPESPRSALSCLPLPAPIPPPKSGKAAPPPIDPGVFRGVTSIRRLIDEAAELSVRASSGLSAMELGSMRSGSVGISSSPWAAAQSLGFNLSGNNTGGRSAAMSAMRIHRLRALAVQKLAQAYKADEIASSVMIMQGGSVFDDIAERVLKVDPNDIDAKYVHFFHEKIPSRQLAESTSTQVLDELIAAQPQRLEFYRTRGTVHCFRDEYSQAIRDFTHALKEARTIRKAKQAHGNNSPQSEQRTVRNGKKRKGSGSKANGRAPPSGTSVSADNIVEGPDGETLYLHPSVLPDAPDPIEPQCLFLRGATYLQHAVFLIENAILTLEGIRKIPTLDGAELRLCYIESGRYGGVEIGNPDGPLGAKDGTKMKAYREVLADQNFKEQICALLKKSIRDHEKFLSHFDMLESPIDPNKLGDIAYQTELAFLTSEAFRPGNHTNTSVPLPEGPVMFTTYHPLLVEAHFSILICQLMLGEFVDILSTFSRTAMLVDGLEGYPVFFPPRSMSQAEFIEVLERLAGGWKHGIQPHSLSNSRARMKGRLAIEPPMKMSRPSSASSSSSSDFDPTAPSSSSIAHQGDGFAVNGSSTQSETHGTSTLSDFIECLDSLRILLAPVAKRQHERTEKAAAAKATSSNKKRPLSINIPLHGPRVEIIMAWLGAVYLPELESCP